MRPTDGELIEVLVPRLKELNAAGCRVFLDFDGLPLEVYLKGNSIYGKWVEGYPSKLDAAFFASFFASEWKPDFTVEDIMDVLWVEITVANYRDKVTALTQKP